MYNISNSVNKKLLNLVNLVKEQLNYTILQIPFYIAGGSVFATLLNTKYKDIDVFLYNEEDLEKLRPEIEKFSVFETKNALTLNDKTIDYFKQSNNDHPLQIIKCKFGYPHKVMETFDINCSKCSITSNNDILFGSDFDANIQISIKNIHNDILFRYQKYIEQKHAQDLNKKELKRILYYLINNLDIKLPFCYKQSSNQLAGANPLDVINDFLKKYSDEKIHQYIHDTIFKLNDSHKRIEIFKELPQIICKTCDEFKLQALLEKQNTSSPFRYNDDEKRLLSNFAEYFI